eukprot:g7758.t1
MVDTNEAPMDANTQPKASKQETSSSTVACLDDVHDDVLFRIFRATVGRPTHDGTRTAAGVRIDPYDDFFGDRDDISPTQNPEFSMVFILPQICRRWRNIMKKFPAVWNKATVSLDHYNTLIPLNWWSKHAYRLESLYMDGNVFDEIGSLSAYNIGIISLLSSQHLKALCLVDCFADGATKAVLSVISHLTSLRQLQIYKAKACFVNELSRLTNLKKLTVLELGCGQCHQMCPKIELSSALFPVNLEVLGLCEARIHMDITTGQYLSNLKCLKLMSSVIRGQFCEHIGNLPNLTKLVVDDAFLDCGGESGSIDAAYLPEDLNKLSNLENIKQLSILGGLDSGQRGYFEWLGEEVLRAPPFTNLESLTLGFPSMGVMAKEFETYANLHYLYIADIKFETIPDPILCLTHLTHLEMVSCDISTFPETPPACANTISFLNLASNKLRLIPKGLATWTNLERLEFTENPLVDFINIEYLLELQKLVVVMLLEGERSVNLLTIDSFWQEFVHMSAAMKFGFVCARLLYKSPPCHVFL